MKWIRPTGARGPLWGGSNVAFPLGIAGFALVLAIVAPLVTRNLSSEADEQKSPIPQRIITIAPNSAEILCALGACDRIVGVSKFCVFPPELEDRPRIGGLFDPDLEKIVSLRPDLIVLRGDCQPVERLCQSRNIPVYHDRTDTLADIERCIRELGALLGRTDEAAASISAFRARLDAVRKRVSGQERPRVLVTVSRRPDRLSNLLTAGRGNFLDEMIRIAGGVNVFGKLDMAYPQISAEAIVTKRAEVIIELMPEVNLTPELERQMMGQWKSLGMIPAVTTGRIHFVTDDHCLIPSPRYTEIIEKVSRILHPEAAGER